MGCASEFTTIDERKLIVKGSQKFKPKLFKFFGSEKPYTGEAINYFESGKKESAGPFHNGRKNGIWTYWHEPVIRKINVGRIESKRLYKFGMRKGFWTYWYPNGEKKEEGNFKLQERVGRWTYFNEKGEVIQTRVF